MIKKIIWTIIVIFLAWCIMHLDSGHTVYVRATVKSHAFSFDKSGGTRTYITVVRTDDGYIEEVEGKDYYALAVGERTSIETTRFDPNNTNALWKKIFN